MIHAGDRSLKAFADLYVAKNPGIELKTVVRHIERVCAQEKEARSPLTRRKASAYAATLGLAVEEFWNRLKTGKASPRIPGDNTSALASALGISIDDTVAQFGRERNKLDNKLTPEEKRDELNREIEALENILRMPAAQVVAEVGREWKEIDESKVRERKRFEEKFGTAEILSEFVEGYYGCKEHNKQGLGLYSLLVDGHHINTTVFVRTSDLRLARPLGTPNKPDQLDFGLIQKEAVSHPTVLEDLRKYALQIYARSRRMKVQLWNDPLYRLLREDIQHGKASFSLIDFFAYRFQSGLLADELIDAAVDCRGDVKLLRERKDKLLLRAGLLPDFDALRNLQNRICAGGIGVVWALRSRQEQGYVIPLQVRSSQVNDGRGRHAVLPKAFHAPLADEMTEVSIRWTLFRELFEEVFRGKEAERPDDHMVHDWYFPGSPPLQWFRDNSDWRGEVVTYGLNAVAGNYDFGILLIVEDPCYYERFKSEIRKNWEAEKTKWISTKDKEGIADLLRQKWASESLLHFGEALRRLKELHPKQVNLPHIDRLIGGVSIGALKE